MTIPIDDEHLLFISMDNNVDEVEKFKNISIKNIAALLENDPTKSEIKLKKRLRKNLI